MATATTNTITTPVKAAAKKTAKKAVASATPAKVEAPKTPVKAAAKKAATKVETKVIVPEKTPKKSAAPAEDTKVSGLGKVHTKVLQTLATSKTVMFPGTSAAGELSYKLIAEESGVAINNLTQTLSAQSKTGTAYPNSLEAQGFIKVGRHETAEGKQTPMLFSITAKGREALKG